MRDPSHPGLAGGVAAAREIVACAERTLAAPSARIQLDKELGFPPEAWPRPDGLPGVMWRVAGDTAKLVATAWLHLTHRPEATGGLGFGHTVGVGIAEPARGRYMIGYGSWAVLYADGKIFGGRSGRALQTLPNDPGLERLEEVLWLLRLLPGTTDAALEGTDTLHGTLCQRLAARVDLARASAASGAGLRPPPVGRFEDLRALPVTVWIDGQHIRRIRFRRGLPSKVITTLDLWEFGVPTADLDWSRLPTFRSPGYEQERKPWYQRVLRRVTAPVPGSDSCASPSLRRRPRQCRGRGARRHHGLRGDRGRW
jgi:hypothetical protein